MGTPVSVRQNGFPAHISHYSLITSAKQPVRVFGSFPDLKLERGNGEVSVTDNVAGFGVFGNLSCFNLLSAFILLIRPVVAVLQYKVKYAVGRLRNLG